MNAGTFYKALSYACLYKAEAGAADIFDADTTVSIVRESHVWITSLTRTLSRDDARELLDNCAELGSEEDRRNADSVVNVASEANVELFKKMIQEGDQMCEELKELLAPEIVEFKIRLAEQDAKLADNAAKLADNAAEIAKLKKLLAEAGIKE